MKENGPITVQILAEEGVELPHYASPEAAGADLRAFIKEEIIIQPGCAALIPTGLKMAIPTGYEIQIRPRSGLALKHQVTVLNSPGTIDADYRGEIQVILINHGREPFHIQPAMRIAQIVLAPIAQASFIPVSLLTTTCRGTGGFGHTGVN